MANCVIDLKTLISSGDANHPYGFWEIVGTYTPGVAIRKTTCGGAITSVTGPSSAQSLMNADATLFRAYNVAANNPNAQGSNANTLLCFDPARAVTFQYKYTIQLPDCDPHSVTGSIIVENGCQFFKSINPASENGSCATGRDMTFGSFIELDEANGVTNGVPWATILSTRGDGCPANDCDIIFNGAIPGTYPDRGNTGKSWTPQVNLATGRITIPNDADMRCDAGCVEFVFSANECYNPDTPCQDCDSGPVSLFLNMPDKCQTPLHYAVLNPSLPVANKRYRISSITVEEDNNPVTYHAGNGGGFFSFPYILYNDIAACDVNAAGFAALEADLRAWLDAKECSGTPAADAYACYDPTCADGAFVTLYFNYLCRVEIVSAVYEIETAGVWGLDEAPNGVVVAGPNNCS